MTQKACAKIRVSNDTVLDLTKPQFLSSRGYEQSFVDYVPLKLAESPGIECGKARNDADCFAIYTALAVAAED